jgi:NDP-sugar pyrophosphorylase family protein
MPLDLPDGKLMHRFIQGFAASRFGAESATPPWHLVSSIERLISAQIPKLGSDYRIDGNVAVHETAHLEDGAIVKGPAIIGPACFVAGTAYLRGAVFLDEHCIIGPAAELKSSLLFKGTKLAHLNFVGDSILGESVNCEAGSIVANYRNELADKRIRIAFDGEIIDTGIEKFGALIGDGVRLGANAVIAPGALITPGTVVPRLGLVDQRPR